MPRKARVEYGGAVYHVMDRGNRLEAIFRDDRDREMFLKTLGEACGRCGWVVHCYVLMGNHYHLLLETPEANLSRGMRLLQGIYTIRHNARHHLRWGTFFKAATRPLWWTGRRSFRQVLLPSRTGMLVREKIPRIPAGRIIFPDRPPLPVAQIRPPKPPGFIARIARRHPL